MNRFVNGADYVDRVVEFGLKGVSLGFVNLDLRVVVVAMSLMSTTLPRQIHFLKPFQRFSKTLLNGFFFGNF